jgi:cellulose synthase/poly-beta-1,6-N-acetylglucosamine synthase-like glycosyltransferase
MLILVLLTCLFLFLSGYVFVGYGVLISVLAWLRPRPVRQGEQPIPVSLIIAAYNEDAVIGDKIQNCLDLDYPRTHLEIIVVADGSADRTAEVARTFPEVKVLFSPERRGKSAAINRGVEQATGEILIFSDANAFYDRLAIQNLVRNFHDPQVGCVSGRKTVVESGQSVAQSEGFYWKYESWVKKKESRLHSATGVVGEMCAVRHSLFSPIPPNIINDDAYLACQIMQAGYRVIYEPAAFSWEYASASTHDEVIRRRRIIAGRYQLLFLPRAWLGSPPLVVFMLISHKFARLLLPFFMIGAFFSNFAVSLMSDAPWWIKVVFAMQVIFYGLALLGYVAERLKVKLKPARIAYYIVSGNAATLSGFARFLSGKQTTLWEKASRSQAPQ